MRAVAARVLGPGPCGAAVVVAQIPLCAAEDECLTLGAADGTGGYRGRPVAAQSVVLSVVAAGLPGPARLVSGSAVGEAEARGGDEFAAAWLAADPHAHVRSLSSGNPAYLAR